MRGIGRERRSWSTRRSDRGPAGRWPMRIYAQAVGPGLRDGAPLALGKVVLLPAEELFHFNGLLKLREAVENG